MGLRRLAVALLIATVAGCGGGSNGEDGVDGQDGAEGDRGPAGADGAQGDRGPTGDQGPAGDEGPTGPTGADGAEGPTGPAGADGAEGPTGPAGADGRDFTQLSGEEAEARITGLSNDGGSIVVNFSVMDNGMPVTGITMDSLRFYITQYIEAENEYDSNAWSDRPFYERSSTEGAADNLVDNGDGTYTYTFVQTLAEAVENAGVDPDRVSQLFVRIRYEDYDAINLIQQYTALPAEGADAELIDEADWVGSIVSTEACASCHSPGDDLQGLIHGGGYVRVEACHMCHTAENPDRLASGTDMATMAHQIHSAYDASQGGTTEGHDFSEVTYPQDVRNCAKCHQGTESDIWNTKPTARVCSSCHTDVNFATGENHNGGAQSNNAMCATCHNAGAIRGYHTTEISTPNNPDVPTGAVVISYQLNSATVDANGIATVNFAILEDGNPMQGLQTAIPSNYTGGPNFRLAYSLPQDGNGRPSDWNNLGQTQGQPIGISLSSLITAGAVTAAADGTYDAVMTTAYPAGATMRAVAIDGYFTQVDVSLARHATSVIIPIEGDDERRPILRHNGCLDCHEALELHGGNRVIAADTPLDSVSMCTICHVPNLSSSGNTFDIAGYLAQDPQNPTFNSSSDATVAARGDDPMTWPEAAQNFKDLVHGIHGRMEEGNAYEHVRVRSGNAYNFDWSEVTYPMDASYCSKCHRGESYALESIPRQALMSTVKTGNPTDRTEALAVRDTVPNADDTVMDPGVAACFSCHDDDMVNAHMDLVGGAMLGATRAELNAAPPAQCAICHGSGSQSDAAMLHPGLN